MKRNKQQINKKPQQQNPPKNKPNSKFKQNHEILQIT